VRFNLQKPLQIFFLILILGLQHAKAADGPIGTIDISSKDVTQSDNNENTSMTVVPAESNDPFSNDSTKNTGTRKNVTNQTTSPSASPTLKKYISAEDRSVIKGPWLGPTLYSQNFTTTAKATINGTQREINSKTADIENAGFTAAYSHMPYDNIGGLFSGTLSSSMNHASLNYSMIISLNLQINLTYAKQYSDKTSYYFYGGLGYETLSGKDITNMVSAGGSAFQGGVGLILYKDFSVEGFYQVTRHQVSSTYLDQLTNYLIAQGATSVTFDSSNSTSNLIAARLTYRY
jgi:hypothetical protein